ncbi:MAG: PTS glucose transporter subunit IIA, partial [Erysipelotrichia bacterium]|nr:PTS glucose transporter subunit IIA [Erysipelotrichia bacterium]
SQLIVQGLGGRDNFDEFDCCITRIRTQIINTAEVNEGLLKQSGAAAVVVTGNSVQIIFGPKASTIKTNLDNYLSNVPIEYDYYEQDADVEETEQTKKVTLQMMVEGECLPIEQAHDEIFSQKLLGDGIMIKPDNGLISAPCDAFVTMVYPSKHAIGLRLDNGCELLIHFGIDTVRLNGEGFELLVKSKQRIKCNDLLWQADLNYIKTHAISENLLIVVTSKDEYSLKKTYGRLERKLAMLEIDKGS